WGSSFLCFRRKGRGRLLRYASSTLWLAAAEQRLHTFICSPCDVVRVYNSLILVARQIGQVPLPLAGTFQSALPLFTFGIHFLLIFVNNALTLTSLLRDVAGYCNYNKDVN